MYTCWVCGNEISAEVAGKLGTSILDLGLSSRVLNCLKRRNIKYVEQVLELTQDDLMRLRNFGAYCMKDLTEKVRAFGFDWNI